MACKRSPFNMLTSLPANRWYIFIVIGIQFQGTRCCCWALYKMRFFYGKYTGKTEIQMVDLQQIRLWSCAITTSSRITHKLAASGSEKSTSTVLKFVENSFVNTFPFGWFVRQWQQSTTIRLLLVLYTCIGICNKGKVFLLFVTKLKRGSLGYCFPFHLFPIATINLQRFLYSYVLFIFKHLLYRLRFLLVSHVYIHSFASNAHSIWHP